MNPINTPVAIRLEFVGFDDPAGRGLFGTERAARSLLRRPAGGREAYRGSLKPEAAKVLADLRTRTAAHTWRDYLWCGGGQGGKSL